MNRRTSTFNTSRIDKLYRKAQYNKIPFYLHYGDLIDGTSINNLLDKIKPDEVYNLAAQSHVSVSFEQPEYTTEVNSLGVLRLLEGIRKIDKNKKIKFYQASTSELYGYSKEIPQNEMTPFYPRSPYGVAKLYAYWIVVNYREAYNMFACNGILFNHESPLRGETFVTRKITRGMTRIKLGLQKTIFLGNLDAKRDWGHARDYAEMQWLMLQQDKPDDYVISTGEQHSVRDFINICAKHLEMRIVWIGKGVDEKCLWLKGNDKIEIIKIDKSYFRPSEVHSLLGDSSKARNDLNWQVKTRFEDLVIEMVNSDLEAAKKEKFLLQNKNNF